MATVSHEQVGFTMREMSDQYESTVKLRNAAANRIRAKIQGADEHSSVVKDALSGSEYYKQLTAAKLNLEAAMTEAISQHPIYDWAMGVPGLNRVTICRIVGLIEMSETNFYEFSRLISYAGYAPGKDRLVKGEKATFCRRLKTSLHVAVSTIIKSSAKTAGTKDCPNKLYSEIYKTWRHTYAHRHGVGPKGALWLEKNGFSASIAEYKSFVEVKGKAAPEWPDSRQNNAALRKVKCYLLAHIWRAWRENAGWPMRPMYFNEVLGHEFQDDLWDFSSPGLAERKKRQRAFEPEPIHIDDEDLMG